MKLQQKTVTLLVILVLALTSLGWIASLQQHATAIAKNGNNTPPTEQGPVKAAPTMMPRVSWNS